MRGRKRALASSDSKDSQPVSANRSLTDRHVNNVNYVRYVETARINWTETLKEELPESTVMSMLVSAHSSLIVQGGVRACRGQCGSVLIE